MRKTLKRGLAYVLTMALTISGLTIQEIKNKEVEVEAATNYQLVWADEFNGSSLDRNAWNVEVNGDGGGNGELQYYLDDADNISVGDGSLKITARKESYGGKNYTSGRINTNNKISVQYGRYEARMKLPSFMGAWPAFWTLGENYDQIGWPNCGEIDIMEAINNEAKIYGTAHWSYNWNATEQGMSYDLDRTQWHTYAMEWDASEIRWYVDGINYYTLPISYEAQMEELIGPQFIIFNLAIGGTWPGYTVDDSAFPNNSSMYVDYVRVYEDKNNTDPKFTTATKNSQWNKYGNWEVYVESGYGNSTAQVAVDPLDGDHIQLQQLTSSWDAAETVMARYTKSGLTPGQKYNISVDLKSNSTDGQYITDARDDGAAITLINGKKTVTKTAVADSNGQVSIFFATGWVGTSVVLDFSNVYCRVYDPNEVIEDPGVMEFISTIKDGEFHDYGNWQIMVGAESGSQAKVAVDGSDKNHIQVQHSQADWGAAYPWSVQARYTAKGLTPNQTYTISVRMLTSSTDGAYVSDATDADSETSIPYENKVKYVTKTGTADANGNLYLTLGFGYSGVGVIIDLDDVSVRAGSTGATATNWNYQEAAANDQLNAYGNWKIYIGASWSGSRANVAVDPSDADHISVVPTASTWVDAWSLQVQHTTGGLTPGATYYLTVDMTSTSTDGSYISDSLPEDVRVAEPLHVGTKTITKIAEADENGNLAITFGLGYVGVGIMFEFENVNVVPYTGEIPTTSQKPTTSQDGGNATTQPPTTQPPQTNAIEVIGQLITSPANNTINVVWGQTEEQLANGQTYNIYLDGNLVYSSVPCNAYDIKDVPAGSHTVKITATLDGKETAGVSATVVVSGSSTVESSSSKEDNSSSSSSGSGPSIELIEVFGMVVENPSTGVIGVVWGNPGNGQLYNVYVDGVIATNTEGVTLSNVECGYYQIPTTAGTHTVKVSATYDGYETTGTSLDVTVSGSAEIVTTTKIETPSSSLDGYTTAGGNWNDLSHWSVYFASGWGGDPTGSYKDGGSYNDFGVHVSKSSLTPWSIQMKTQPMTVVAGTDYVCTVTVDVNANLTNTIMFKDEITGTEYTYTPVEGTNTFTVEFTPTTDTAQFFFDLGMLPTGTLFEITSFSLVGEEAPTEPPTEPPVVDPTVSIDGFQISTKHNGSRVVYTLDESGNTKDVAEVGLIYGLGGYANASQMTATTTGEYVVKFAATNAGIYTTVDSKTTYVMTMAMNIGQISVAGLTAEYMVRAYAKLADGTYVYSDVETYSLYSIADVLYQNSSMSTSAGHNYLYNNILFPANNSYLPVFYDSTNSIA